MRDKEEKVELTIEDINPIIDGVLPTTIQRIISTNVKNIPHSAIPEGDVIKSYSRRLLLNAFEECKVVIAKDEVIKYVLNYLNGSNIPEQFKLTESDAQKLRSLIKKGLTKTNIIDNIDWIADKINSLNSKLKQMLRSSSDLKELSKRVEKSIQLISAFLDLKKECQKEPQQFFRHKELHGCQVKSSLKQPQTIFKSFSDYQNPEIEFFEFINLKQNPIPLLPTIDKYIFDYLGNPINPPKKEKKEKHEQEQKQKEEKEEQENDKASKADKYAKDERDEKHKQKQKDEKEEQENHKSNETQTEKEKERKQKERKNRKKKGKEISKEEREQQEKEKEERERERKRKEKFQESTQNIIYTKFMDHNFMRSEPNTVIFWSKCEIFLKDMTANLIWLNILNRRSVLKRVTNKSTVPQFSGMNSSALIGYLLKRRPLVDVWKSNDLETIPGSGIANRTPFNELSRTFAQRASGVVFFISGDKDPETGKYGDTWENIEKPALLNNPLVTIIIEIDIFNPEKVKSITFPHGIKKEIKSEFPIFSNLKPQIKYIDYTSTPIQFIGFGKNPITNPLITIIPFQPTKRAKSPPKLPKPLPPGNSQRRYLKTLKRSNSLYF